MKKTKQNNFAGVFLRLLLSNPTSLVPRVLYKSSGGKQKTYHPHSTDRSRSAGENKVVKTESSGKRRGTAAKWSSALTIAPTSTHTNTHTHSHTSTEHPHPHTRTHTHGTPSLTHTPTHTHTHALNTHTHPHTHTQTHTLTRRDTSHSVLPMETQLNLL